MNSFPSPSSLPCVWKRNFHLNIGWGWNLYSQSLTLSLLFFSLFVLNAALLLHQHPPLKLPLWGKGRKTKISTFIRRQFVTVVSSSCIGASFFGLAPPVVKMEKFYMARSSFALCVWVHMDVKLFWGIEATDPPPFRVDSQESRLRFGGAPTTTDDLPGSYVLARVSFIFPNQVIPPFSFLRPGKETRTSKERATAGIDFQSKTIHQPRPFYATFAPVFLLLREL